MVWARRIPCVISGNSFGDDFRVGIDSVSLTVYESTGVVWDDESIRHL